MVYNITIYSIQILNLQHQQVSYHLSILDLYLIFDIKAFLHLVDENLF